MRKRLGECLDAVWGQSTRAPLTGWAHTRVPRLEDLSFHTDKSIAIPGTSSSRNVGAGIQQVDEDLKVLCFVHKV